MKTTRRCGKSFDVVCCVALVATLATMSRASDCHRYISVDGANTMINQTCAEKLGITPIYVRDTNYGYDIVIPDWSNAKPEYGALAPAAMHWLSSGSNLADTISVVDFAQDALRAFPIADPDGPVKIERVNYMLSSWLDTSGASATIADAASNFSLSAGGLCQQIPVCTSCEWYHCTTPDEWWVPDLCFCMAWGWDCCVIRRDLSRR